MKRFGLWLLILSLAGCAAIPASPARPSTENLTEFAFAGRITVRQGEQRHHLKIDWRHAPADDEILLTTPFGQGVARLSRNAAGAVLELADKRRFAAADWGELAAEVFGFRLPLSGATRWLVGDLAATDGWQVTIVERESTAPNALPSIIELERDDIVVRVKIDEWTEVR